VKDYPAIDVRTDAPDLLLAIVDDFAPTAVEDIDSAGTVRIFFATARDRDTARRALDGRYAVTPVDVSDEDWARRSQENLTPVTVGRITLFPNPDARPNRESRTPNPLFLVIQPSMGFGTGHHATTRLCLAALQTIESAGRAVLDAGTGSGVLAMAAARLGAARAIGIDYDADAIQSANENLALNPAVHGVSFELADLANAKSTAGPSTPAGFDVVTANLTGALLVKSAARLLDVVGSDGLLILSGVQAHERDDVAAAFAPAMIVGELEEDGWVALTMKKP